MVIVMAMTCLNPCFNGIVLNDTRGSLLAQEQLVLILVLMESS